MRKAERREPQARWLCHGHVMSMPRLGSLFTKRFNSFRSFYLLCALCVTLANPPSMIRCRTSRLGRFRAPYAAPGVRRDARPTLWPSDLGLSLVGP